MDTVGREKKIDAKNATSKQCNHHKVNLLKIEFACSASSMNEFSYFHPARITIKHRCTEISLCIFGVMILMKTKEMSEKRKVKKKTMLALQRKRYTILSSTIETVSIVLEMNSAAKYLWMSGKRKNYKRNERTEE